MKKFLKIFGIFVLVVVVAVGALAAWQWKYVSALIDGIRYDEEALAQKQVENAEKTISSVNEQVSVTLRDITEEEKALIASGELSQTELMAQILTEAVGTELPAADTEAAAGETTAEGTTAEGTATEGGETSAAQGSASEGNTSSSQQGSASQQTGTSQQSSTSSGTQHSTITSDQYVAAAVSQLYSLQSQYTSQLDGLVSRAKSYYISERDANGSASAKASTLAKFSGEVASMENSCDAQVEAVLSELTGNLNAIGADTAIVSTLRSAYESEKSVQRAAYVNRYMN